MIMWPSRPRESMSRPLAFVTGASVGIGAATARALARAGYDLVLVGRREELLREVAKGLPGAHHALALDLRDKQALARAQEQRPELFERVDVLVNNAGLARGTDPVQGGDPDEWDEVIDTNVKALLRLTRAIVPHMVKRGDGHVVNLGSTAGHWVYPGGAVYCASKHAVRAITEGLRMDIHGSGVRVTEVSPGLVGGTEFSDVRFRGDHDRARKVYEGVQPLTPEDIAETIVWCVQRPKHVNIQEVVLMPVAQASVTMVKRS